MADHRLQKESGDTSNTSHQATDLDAVSRTSKLGVRCSGGNSAGRRSGAIRSTHSSMDLGRGAEGVGSFDSGDGGSNHSRSGGVGFSLGGNKGRWGGMSAFDSSVQG